MSLMDWLYPKRCVGCGRKGSYGCGDCLSQVKIRDEQSDNCVSLFKYQGLVRKMIQRLKFSYLRKPPCNASQKKLKYNFGKTSSAH